MPPTVHRMTPLIRKVVGVIPEKAPKVIIDIVCPILERVLLTELGDRERKLLVLRYGLEDGIRRKPKEVANFFGITRGRVWQIEKRALSKLTLAF